MNRSHYSKNHSSTQGFSPTTVSYTHLDVYKRQPLGNGLFSKSREIF